MDTVRGQQNHAPHSSFCWYPLQFILVLSLPTVLLTLLVALPQMIFQASSSMLQSLERPGQKQQSQWPEAQQEGHWQQEPAPSLWSNCWGAGRWQRDTKTAQVDPVEPVGGWVLSVPTCHISWGPGRVFWDRCHQHQGCGILKIFWTERVGFQNRCTWKTPGIVNGLLRKNYYYPRGETPRLGLVCSFQLIQNDVPLR